MVQFSSVTGSQTHGKAVDYHGLPTGQFPIPKNNIPVSLPGGKFCYEGRDCRCESGEKCTDAVNVDICAIPIEG